MQQFAQTGILSLSGGYEEEEDYALTIDHLASHARLVHLKPSLSSPCLKLFTSSY